MAGQSLSANPTSSPTQMVNWFLKSVIVILAITAGLKVYALLGGQMKRAAPDPVLPAVPVWVVTLTAIVAESAVLLVLLWRRPAPGQKLMAVAWLGTCFAAYRALWTLAVPADYSCPCLGYFLDSLGVPARVTRSLSLALLGYLLAGAGAGLMATWRAGASGAFSRR